METRGILRGVTDDECLQVLLVFFVLTNKNNEAYRYPEDVPVDFHPPHRRSDPPGLPHTALAAGAWVPFS